MHPISITTFTVVCLLSCSSSYLRARAQSTQKIVLTKEVDTFIDQVIANWTSPGGAAVTVVKLDEQGEWHVETKGYWIATLNGTRVTENTRFGIGSNSKLFNILATGLLVNNETISPRLSWTTKIASIVPIWGLQGPIASKQASLLDVMSHRTGMPRHDFHYKWKDDVPTVFLKPSAEFREIWQYDNSMYTLLSYLPSLFLPSKTPFPRYVKEHILALGMTSTTYSFDVADGSGLLADGMIKQLTSPNDIFGNGTIRAMPFWVPLGSEDGNVLSGAAGVISTAKDMAIWLQTLLLDGVKPGTNTSVIPVSAIERAASGISVEVGQAPFPELSPVVYGGVQARSTYRGHELIERGGDVPGFHSQVSRMPFDNLGVAVLTNDHLPGGGRLEQQAGALVSIPQPPATLRPTTNLSLLSVNFTTIAGKYSNDGYGDFELCIISPKDPAASPACQVLASGNPTTLPGLINPKVPTFIGAWDSPWASHIMITHFNGDSCNVTAFSVYPTGDPTEPFWTQGDDGTNFDTYAELVVDQDHVGLGITGIWGAGVGVPSPQGKTARERSEVWFDKI
ncbi:beta-lactamase/transpeptidase-like protein [Collybia nuda]|uniref:Beta-lactamase/transpeptidase-like protein n=1 Tax=Collybia nuda TaxID=64659 RepID=A0A9P6CCG5_9AGAR|nr:beta-lactamase/transpeptidase-like protein [Collybia nuda]